jgi:hypothetical protein
VAGALPLASTSFTSGAQGEIYFGLAKAVDVYLVVLTVRILLSWFRNINWFGEPFNTLRQVGREAGREEQQRFACSVFVVIFAACCCLKCLALVPP